MTSINSRILFLCGDIYLCDRKFTAWCFIPETGIIFLWWKTHFCDRNFYSPEKNCIHLKGTVFLNMWQEIHSWNMNLSSDRNFVLVNYADDLFHERCNKDFVLTWLSGWPSHPAPSRFLLLFHSTFTKSGYLILI